MVTAPTEKDYVLARVSPHRSVEGRGGGADKGTMLGSWLQWRCALAESSPRARLRSMLQELRVGVSDLMGPPHSQEVSWEQFPLYP